MDGYLLDTNIVSYYYNPQQRQHERVAQRLAECPQESPLFISAITLGEIEYGLAVVSEQRTTLSGTLRAFVDDHFPMVLDISKTTCTYYGTLRAKLFEHYAPGEKRRSRLRPEQLVDPVTSHELGIQENDVWIAAQALELNLVLVTNDKLQRIREVCRELRVVNWTV